MRHSLMHSLRLCTLILLFAAAAILMLSAGPACAGTSEPATAAPPPPGICMGGMRLPPGDGDDIKITGLCKVGAGSYSYHNINIYGGGMLIFLDENIDLTAESILVERDGTLEAGTTKNPIGKNGKLVIHLYGENQGIHGKGIPCQYDVHCGVPGTIWGTNGSEKVNLPGGVFDYFYDYKPLDFDDGDPNAYFGYKVLGVGYGGSLLLYGQDGASYPEGGDLKPYDSGESWARLIESVDKDAQTLKLDRIVNWQHGDRIVVTTTDYIARHSEVVTVDSVDNEGDTSVVTLSDTINFPHNGKRYDLSDLPAGVGPEPDPNQPPDTPKSVETRAAVALLTRSIQIVSAGNAPDAPLDATGFFGGHTVFRQGFKQIDIHGVEFYQMGQGGKIMHYPVHFHMARKTPAGTTIADCSVDDSMTRWYVLHATQNVLLERNVGYLSIGHGYYLEDGTETDNKLYSNIGITVRAAVQNNMVNPRSVPGILAAKYPPYNYPQEAVPFHSDVDHPTVFWIMNGWNDFEYNMASGADTCGACYWLLPGYNSGMSRMEKWEYYAAEQRNLDLAGSTPLYKFVGNYCNTAMNSFNTIADTVKCSPIINENPDLKFKRLEPVTNDLAPDIGSPQADAYYPKVVGGGSRLATLCPDAACQVSRCAYQNEENCAVTVLDHYTTSYNWAETNFGAIWLRPQWYLFTNSAITDIQNGGLSFITGGGYTASDVIPGHWALAYHNVFVGNTQDPADDYYASNAGPFNPDTPLRCEKKTDGAVAGTYCLDRDLGLIMLLGSFGVNQRFFNIYDGPSYQDSNAYVHIVATDLKGCMPNPDGGTCEKTNWMYGPVLGVTQRRPQEGQSPCYLPNAAIGWKQPNGFYYPPAFHSTNLFFDDVPIRHFVIEPLFEEGTYKLNRDEAAERYCNWNDAIFSNFTDVDRQTELDDDDGSLTGQIRTISVNEDPFFNAPVEQIECASDVPEFTPPGTAKTSPYDYVTTVEYPACGLSCGPKVWNRTCTAPFCYGVPLYRLLVNPDESKNGKMPAIRMAGQDTAQRSTLTVNNASYYIDTTVSLEKQVKTPGITSVNVFQNNQTYYTFLLFAKPQIGDRSATKQQYEMYVGPGFDVDRDLSAVRVNPATEEPVFTPTSWPDGYWNKSYDASTGVLRVTMRMTMPSFAMDYEAAKSDDCQPKSFCKLDSDENCGCSLDEKNGIYAECQHACSRWAGNDIDCPENGCWGFSVKLTTGFRTGPKNGLPPAPKCYPKSENWNVKFMPAEESVAGACYDPTPPVGKFCDQQNWKLAQPQK